MSFNNVPKKYLVEPSKGNTRYTPEIIPMLAPYNEKKWKNLFPFGTNANFNYKNLQLTNLGLYSISRPYISKAISEFLLDLISKYFNDKPSSEWIVTESHGGLGGFTLELTKHFKKINIVEINPMHADIIKNNLEVYGYDDKKYPDITIYNDDYLNIADKLDQDIIVSDLPWGGTNYYKQKSIKLGINNINITYIINKLYDLNKFSIYILLAPSNFNIQNFINEIKASTIIIHNMGKHYIIGIINRNRNNQKNN